MKVRRWREKKRKSHGFLKLAWKSATWQTSSHVVGGRFREKEKKNVPEKAYLGRSVREEKVTVF